MGMSTTISVVSSTLTSSRLSKTQHPTPNTQHPTPNTQHPTPNTQHPTPNMPIFEYRCGECRRRFSLLVGVVAAGPEARCPRCGSERISRLISRFAVARSEEDLLDNM